MISANNNSANKSSIVSRLLGVGWLDEGRSLEAYLAGLCGIYAIFVIINPENLGLNPATRGINPATIVIPLLTKAFLTGSGLYFRIKGFRIGNLLRLSGAIVGACIWGWFFGRMLQVGLTPLTCAVSTCGFLASIRMVGLSIISINHPLDIR